MKVKSSIADKILQGFCLALLVGMTFYLLAGWSTFSDKLPMHFGASGRLTDGAGKEFSFLCWWCSGGFICFVQE